MEKGVTFRSRPFSGPADGRVIVGYFPEGKFRIATFSFKIAEVNSYAISEKISQSKAVASILFCFKM